MSHREETGSPTDRHLTDRPPTDRPSTGQVPANRPSRRRWAATGGLAAISLAVALAVAELMVGWLVHLEEVTLVHDPLLGFRGRAHMTIPWTREMEGGQRTVRTNAGGWHDHERRREVAPGIRRLAFLGDSFLEAYQVEVDESFPQQLARRLSEPLAAAGVGGMGAGSANSVEAVNFGVHGYGLGVHHLFVRHYLNEWASDAVVLALFLGNDLHDNYAPVASASVPRFTVENGELVYTPSPAGGWRVWLRDRVLARSSLMRFAWMRLVKTNRGAMQLARRAGLVSTPNMVPAATADRDRMLATADHLLGQIAADLDRADIGLLVFVIPDPIRLHHRLLRERGQVSADPQELIEQKADLEEGLLRILRERGIQHLYPRAEFEAEIRAGKALYRGGFGHFTSAAHHLSARLLVEPARRQFRGREGS